MSRDIRHYTDLRVWRKAHDLFLEMYRVAEGQQLDGPGWVVAQQVLRSAGSISANIAEGFNRSRRRFANSLDIAAGEANETENWLYKMRDTGLITQNNATRLLKLSIEVQKMLYSLKTKIENNETAICEDGTTYRIWNGD